MSAPQPRDGIEPSETLPNTADDEGRGRYSNRRANGSSVLPVAKRFGEHRGTI